MKDDIKKLILDLALENITKEQFNKLFVNSNSLKNYIIESLINAYEMKDSEMVEYILLLYFSMESFEFNSSNTSLLGKLLIENWHKNHEDIVTIFQKIKDPLSVIYLEQAINLKLKYMEYNEGESLIRKCAFALHDINTELSISILKKLSYSENQIIRSASLEQIKDL